MASTNDNDLRLDALQVVILVSLIVPRLIPDHVAILVGDLRTAVKAFDGGVQSPDPQAILRFDQVQNTTCAHNIGIKPVHNLKPCDI